MLDSDETNRLDDQTIIEQHQGRQTLGDVDLSDFLRHQTRSRVAGMFTPVKASTMERFEIDSPEFVVGRDTKCSRTLGDDSVSRRHAIIRKTMDDQFIIEDLGSSNGTYVDGIPIVSCVLHSGDTVQLGRNLFIFDSLLEFIKCGDSHDGF